jgi:hypothetical protein
MAVPMKKLLMDRLFGREFDTYGFNEIVRLYSGYPEHLPLLANIYHGWYIVPPRQSDLQSPRELLLTFNRRQADEWKAHSDKAVAVLGTPFIHYRRMMNIQRRDDAAGTIAYPGHDATSNDFVFDQGRFCERLLSLDRRYHPFTVSVMEQDIANGKDKIYHEYGFRTFCPGPRRTIRFCKNFYAELSRHRYSCGNHVGTHILYAVDMGIPFFLLDELGHGVNRNTGEAVAYQRTPAQLALLKRVRTLFAEPVDEVTPEQRRLIVAESGLEDCLPPDELRRLLLRTLFTREVPAVTRRLAMWPVNSVRRRAASRQA